MTTEAFGAARISAGVGFLSRMGANMSGLMLKSMKSLIAERTFVGSGHFSLPILCICETPIIDGLRH